ncbi:MAG: N-acetylneuraminate synthase [Bacteroidota bacterium]|jgi:N-acetylneuraminate synthase
MITNKKVLIIAEAGVNHNGDVNLAKKLIDVAVDAKVDIVKFQTFIAENVISKNAQKAQYQKESTGVEESQLEMVKKLQLTFDNFTNLKRYCEEKGIMFLSTPFDLESVDFLKTLNMGIWKIPSGEITNLPYLTKIGQFNQEVIFSSGMATLEEIENTINILVKAGTSKNKISVLHCNTEYPTPMKDVNLKAMQTIKEAFNINVGYSDHTLGIEIPVAAVAMGATIIEKHFTLNKTMEGPDHLASLNPEELKNMVTAIRNIEMAMGVGIKAPSESERKNILVARKSVHLKNDLPLGHTITDNDLVMKRPGDGISPLHIEKVIGKKLKSNLKIDHKLSWEDIE